MKYRSDVNKKKDKKIFTKTAQKTKKVNYVMPMRGGIRL